METEKNRGSKILQSVHALKKLRQTGNFDLTMGQILSSLTEPELAIVSEITRFKTSMIKEIAKM